jgi:hypothetical protein
MARKQLIGREDFASRWLSAAVELDALLQQSDELLDRRDRLRRDRAELFRQIVEQARTFVDSVPRTSTASHGGGGGRP